MRGIETLRAEPFSTIRKRMNAGVKIGSLKTRSRIIPGVVKSPMAMGRDRVRVSRGYLTSSGR